MNKLYSLAEMLLNVQEPGPVTRTINMGSILKPAASEVNRTIPLKWCYDRCHVPGILFYTRTGIAERHIQ